MTKANFQTDFGGLAEAIGTIYGLTDGLDDDIYLESLIMEAHAKTANEFDLAAASAAGSGYLTHVYEFGTAGITRGPVRFPDPTSPSARLWVHNISGNGGNQNISFAFRPAVAPNPQPTVASTGVASKYLRKLSRRKYVFRNKAMVMEAGTSVEIRPKNGNLLFVPFYGEMSETEGNDKGFMMYPFAPRNKPIVTTPGRNSAGTFTAFWSAWWAGVGEKRMASDIRNNLNSDVVTAINTAARRGNATKTTGALSDFVRRAESAKGITEHALHARTLKRRRTVR